MSDSSSYRWSLRSSARAMACLCVASLAVFLAVSQPLRAFLREIVSLIAKVSGE
jgi:hypothetical protein